MTRLDGAALLAGALLLGACGGPDRHLRDWTATTDVTRVAYDECIDEVDTTMRLRGYPHRPLPETPHFAYRREILTTCMRRKGYEPG